MSVQARPLETSADQAAWLDETFAHLGLKRVRELPPALDDAAALAVVRPRVHEVRTDGGERVRQLLGAIYRPAVGVCELRRTPHEQRAEHGVAQARQILGEVPPVGDGIARGVVDEGAELGGGQAPVGRQDLGPVVVVADPQVAERVELHLDRGLGTEHDELPPRRATPAQVPIERRAMRLRGRGERALADQDVDHRARPARGQLAPERLRALEHGDRGGTQAAAIPTMQRPECVDTAAPEQGEPGPQRAARDRDLTVARMQVSFARARGDPHTQGSILALLEQAIEFLGVRPRADEVGAGSFRS